MVPTRDRRTERRGPAHAPSSPTAASRAPAPAQLSTRGPGIPTGSSGAGIVLAFSSTGGVARYVSHRRSESPRRLHAGATTIAQAVPPRGSRAPCRLRLSRVAIRRGCRTRPGGVPWSEPVELHHATDPDHPGGASRQRQEPPQPAVRPVARCGHRRAGRGRRRRAGQPRPSGPRSPTPGRGRSRTWSATPMQARCSSSRVPRSPTALPPRAPGSCGWCQARRQDPRGPVDVGRPVPDPSRGRDSAACARLRPGRRASRRSMGAGADPSIAPPGPRAPPSPRAGGPTGGASRSIRAAARSAGAGQPRAARPARPPRRGSMVCGRRLVPIGRAPRGAPRRPPTR